MEDVEKLQDMGKTDQGVNEGMEEKEKRKI